MTSSRGPSETFYESWMKKEALPLYRGYGLPDVSQLERADWARTGGRAAFVHLVGMEGFTGMHIGEIPARKSLEPQKHLYQQYIVIIEGRGATDVWLPGDSHKVTFEWGANSLFSIPLNCAYLLHNTGPDPVIYMAVNDAPMVMDLFHNERFVFDNDYRFEDRFEPTAEYFSASHRYENYVGGMNETNFVPDMNALDLDSHDVKGHGVDLTVFEMAGNTLVGHVTTWPTGRYHKAHHHLGGAILYGLQSQGYVLLWPQEAGARPYQDGNEGRVVRVDWGPRGVYSPPSKWFHQHFNTGSTPARQLAFRGGVKHPTGIRRAGNPIVDGRAGVFVSVAEGGSLVPYALEDPRIRADYVAALAENGVPCDMPLDVYVPT